MKNRDVVLGLVVLALVGLGVYWARGRSVTPEHSQTAAPSTAWAAGDAAPASAAVSPPDVTQSDGTVNLGDVRIVLSLDPKPPVAFAKFRARVQARASGEGGGPTPLESGRVYFEMTMPMGDHRVLAASRRRRLAPGRRRAAALRERRPAVARHRRRRRRRPAARRALQTQPGPAAHGVVQVIQTVDLLGFLMLGLIGGFGHCVGMCAPFVLFVSRQYTPAGAGRRAALGVQAWYTVGRITTYMLLGFAAGSLGGVVELAGSLLGLQRAAAIIAGGALVAWGSLALCNLLPDFGTGGRVFGRLSAALRGKVPGHPFVTGLFLGLLPCGLLYSAITASVARGSAVDGAAALGTVRHRDGAGADWPLGGRPTPHAQPGALRAAFAGARAGDGVLVPVEGARRRLVTRDAGSCRRSRPRRLSG